MRAAAAILLLLLALDVEHLALAPLRQRVVFVIVFVVLALYAGGASAPRRRAVTS